MRMKLEEKCGMHVGIRACDNVLDEECRWYPMRDPVYVCRGQQKKWKITANNILRRMIIIVMSSDSVDGRKLSTIKRRDM